MFATFDTQPFDAECGTASLCQAAEEMQVARANAPVIIAPAVAPVVAAPSAATVDVPFEPKVMGQFKQDMIVLTSRLLVDEESLPYMDRVVRGLEQFVKDSGVTAEQAEDLEADLNDEPVLKGKGGKAPRKRRTTKKNTQATLEIPDLVVSGIPTNVVVRFKDYTTDSNHRRGNFRNQVTLRHGVKSGPTLKLFRNGTLQGAGWKSVKVFVDYVNVVAEHFELPRVNEEATKLSLVNGSARIQLVPAGGIPMNNFRDSMEEKGYKVKWDPNTGNNGANVKIPDGENTRSAMVFSNGYVKMFALDEGQLVRIYETLDGMLMGTISGGIIG